MNATENGQPLGLGLSEGLGPLPEGDVTALSEYFDAEGQRQGLAYTTDQMRAYALRERAALRASIEPAWAQSLEYARGDERAKLRALIADDASAITYQSLGQYRTALLRALRA